MDRQQQRHLVPCSVSRSSFRVLYSCAHIVRRTSEQSVDMHDALEIVSMQRSGTKRAAAAVAMHCRRRRAGNGLHVMRICTTTTLGAWPSQETRTRRKCCRKSAYVVLLRQTCPGEVGTKCRPCPRRGRQQRGGGGGGGMMDGRRNSGVGRRVNGSSVWRYKGIERHKRAAEKRRTMRLCIVADCRATLRRDQHLRAPGPG